MAQAQQAPSSPPPSANGYQMANTSTDSPQRTYGPLNQMVSSNNTSPTLFRYLSQQEHGDRMPAPPASTVVSRDSSQLQPHTQYSESTKPRSAQACDNCRRRKVKCDTSSPCSACIRSGIPDECTFSPPAQRRSKKPQQNGHALHEPRPLHSLSSRPLHNLPGSPYANGRARNSYSESPNSTNTGLKRPYVSDNAHGAPDRYAKSPRLQPPLPATSCERSSNPFHWNGTVVNNEKRSRFIPSLRSNAMLNRMLPRFRECISSLVDDPEVQEKLKGLSKMLQKRSQPTHLTLPADYEISKHIPHKAICDKLIGIFFATLGSIFRIVDRTDFEDEYQTYWTKEGEATAGTSLFTCKLALIVASASYLDHNHQLNDQQKTSLCIDVDSRLKSMSGGICYTIDYLQTHCLLHLARQPLPIDSCSAWRSSRDLVAIAMTLGLHTSTDLDQTFNTKNREIRQGMWTAVLELELQASLSAGMRPTMKSGELLTEKSTPSRIVNMDTYSYALPSTLARSLSERLYLVDKMGANSTDNSTHELVSEGIPEFTIGTRGSDSRLQLACIVTNLLQWRPFLAAQQMLIAGAVDDEPFEEDLSDRAEAVRMSMNILSMLDVFDSEVTDLPIAEAQLYWQYVAKIFYDTFLQASHILCSEINRDESIATTPSQSKPAILHALNRLLSRLLENGPDPELRIKDLARLAMMIQYARTAGSDEQKGTMMRQALDRVVDTCQRRNRSQVAAAASTNGCQTAGESSDETVADERTDWDLLMFDGVIGENDKNNSVMRNGYYGI